MNITDVPSRIIIHVDLDCFYCQVEQKRLSIPREQPCAVQQWGGLIAVNYAARKLGISKLSNTTQALEICPDLRCVHVEVLDEKGSIGIDEGSAPSAQLQYHGKASLARYRRASVEVFKVFRATFPSCVIEKASIDEAYVDLTDEVAKELEKGGADGGIARAQADLASVAQNSVVVGGQLLPGSDFDARLATAARLTANLRARVFESLDYTVSAGISHNKLLAKLASGMNKPNNQTIIPVSVVSSLMQDLALNKIRNFGGKLGHVLESLGCVTAADVQKLSLQQLEAAVGDSAKFVMRACRGVSDEEVTEKSVPKSMLAAKAFPVTKSWQTIEHWIKVLSGELADRMAEDSDLHNRRPKNLVVQYRRADAKGRWNAGTERSKSAHLQSSDVPSSSELFDVAMGILRSVPELMPCNRLAISTNSFQPLAGSDGGLINQMFSLTPKKSAPKGCTKDKAAGGRNLKGDTAFQDKPGSLKPKLMVTQAATKQIPKAAAAAAAQQSIIQAHLSKPQNVENIFADVARPASTMCAVADSGSLPPQGPQHSTMTKRARSPQSQGAVTAMRSGSWVQRRKPIVSHNVQLNTQGSSLHTGTMQYSGGDRAGIPSVDDGKRAPCGSGAMGTPGAQHGVDSAAKRWMQWAQRAAVEKQVVDDTAEQFDPSIDTAKVNENCGTEGPAALWSEQQTMLSNRPASSEPTQVAKQEIVDLADEPGCDLGGVDIAEQRHILNLIQMKAPRVGRSTMSPDKHIGVNKGGVRKQSSILSLLSKK